MAQKRVGWVEQRETQPVYWGGITIARPLYPVGDRRSVRHSGDGRCRGPEHLAFVLTDSRLSMNPSSNFKDPSGARFPKMTPSLQQVQEVRKAPLRPARS